MDIFEAEMVRRFVVAVEKIANVLDRKTENCSEKPNNCEEPQTEYDKGLKLFADILFDKDKSNQFLEECKAMGIEPQTMYYPQVDGITPSVIEPQTQLTAKCLECNNSKACKENHWEGCRYEPLGYEVTAVVGTIKDEPQTYITEDRDTQILDAWQVHHRTSTTAVEDKPQTERSV